ncbi:hypothetical protein QAD02_005541 [Eretmocerus hayati]|uniref:Uncharacterized protein n=1 Tax=Eretmocerus hayati TaxID=131215 RepID=A0ACC2NT65_9HYME|nr:hypothetical protein QAD02_005541 [Eretmocerus hayati]
MCVISFSCLRGVRSHEILSSLKIFKRSITSNKWLKRKMGNEKLPPHRSNPIIKKLETPEFKSIFTPELEELSRLFKKYNFELRVAGGAVRDIVMGINPKDLDFATTATPTEMKDLFTKEEVRMINTNGEKHGTITPRINDKMNFEVTTLRIDVVTNGRHAEVEFTTDWLLDASRRDLTVNSMFLDLEGNVYDYFYGYDDLMKRRVAFVGDPAERIQEDFLRILRYFRFYGRMAEVAENHDEQTISAIKNNAEGLGQISGERIWMEWSKILSGNFHRELTQKMIECGCSTYMGLPDSVNLKHFNEVCLKAHNNGIRLRPVSYVAALLNTEEEFLAVFQRLKFTNFDRNLGLFLVQYRFKTWSDKPLKPYQRLVLKTIGKVSDMREYINELLRYRGDLHLLEEFEKWDGHFPINGRMIISHLESGKNHKVIGDVISRLKDVWLDHDCDMPVEKLEAQIPSLIAEVQEEMKERSEKMKELKSKKMMRT